MSNVKNVNAKNEKLSKINFDKFTTKVYNVSEKSSSQRATLYNYPENFGAMQINGIEGRNFRGKLRRELQTICNAIYLSKKSKDGEKFVSAVNSFMKFYKTNFKLNDFSINSITNTKDEKQEFINDCLKDVQTYLSSVTAPKKEKVKKDAVKKIKIVVAPVIEKEIIA